jgi:hypothetical protein
MINTSEEFIMIRNKKLCEKCNREISLSNYSKHNKACKGFIKKSKPKKIFDWANIQKDYDSGLSYRQIAKKHYISQMTLASAKKKGRFATRTPSEAKRNYDKNNPPAPMSLEARERQSIRMSTHNPGGKSKWFEVNGKKVQGTWERTFALYCNENNIVWDRCKPWKYVLNGKTKRYTPDFYLPAYDIYIEIKGRWWGNDREKMDAVIEQHPDKKIFIIEKEQYNDLDASLAYMVGALL